MAVDISKLLDKAREAVERRNYDYAIELYLQACKMSPDDATAARELRAVEIRVAKEKPPGFMAKAKMVAKVGQAQTMMLSKKYDAAIEAAEDALRIDPGNMFAAMIVGRAANLAGYPNRAISVFEDIANAKGSGDKKAHIEALRELSHAFEITGRMQEAIARYQELQRLHPEDREAGQKIRDITARAMTKTIEDGANAGAAQGGKMAATRNILKSGAEVQKQERSQQELRTSEDVAAAIKDAQEDIKQRPEDARLYSKLGDLYRRQENYAESKKAYQVACQKDPTNPQWKIVKLDDLEIWKKSKDYTDLAAKVGDPVVVQQRIKMFIALMEYKLQSFEAREKQYATDSRIKFELGSAYFNLAEHRKDLAMYDQCIMRYQFTYKDPKYRTESGLRMGIAFTRKGQFDLALKRFDETLSTLEVKDDRWKNLVYEKASTLEHTSKHQESLQCFLQIYELDVAFRDVSKRVEALQKKVASPA